MGEVLSNPPVFHTLVQIYFQENPNLKDNVETIYQELHKRALSKSVMKRFSIMNFRLLIMNFKVTQQDSWHFINFEQDVVLF
jgi:hypothetical protein